MAAPATGEARGAETRLDFWAGTLVTAAALFAVLWLIPGHVQVHGSNGSLPPAFLPFLSAGVILCCGIAMMAVNRRALLRPGDGALRVLLVDLAIWTVILAVTFALQIWIGTAVAGAAGIAAGVVLTRHRGSLLSAAAIVLLLPFLLVPATEWLFSVQLP